MPRLGPLIPDTGPRGPRYARRAKGIVIETTAFVLVTLTFPLLSDYNKDVIRAYDVVNPDMIGLKDIAKRAVFVIGADGVVKHKQVLDDARNEPDYDKVRAAVSAL